MIRKFLLCALLLTLLPMYAQDVASFEKRIQVRTLPNGLTVILMQRKEAPVFSFFTLVDAGSAQDPKGASGLAHMFEHMAFKGTDSIGTTNYAAEKIVLEKIEKAYAAYIAERDKRVGQDPKKLAELEKQWQDLTAEAEKYVIRNQFPDYIERNGGVGLNASTSEDDTTYYYSMPVNRLELWSYLESERFLQPVMREFYKERDVVYEERRMRVESNPIGRLLEQFQSAAFTAHPYGTPGIGWPSDLHSFSATEAMEFYRKYYVPTNMTIAVVGDIEFAKTWPVIEKYFGRLPKRPQPDEALTTEPPQTSERQVVLREMSQPVYIEGYHRPDYRNKDDVVYDAISDVVSNGRTSRLYRSLVRDKRIALQAGGFSGLPGIKYPHLFAFYGIPNREHTADEIRTALRVEIERLKNEDITDDELQMVKTRAKAGLIRSLGSNSGLASQLAVYQARFGDWREMFHQIDKIEKVTKADIRRVANATFVDTNRTVGILETTRPAAARQQPGAQSQNQQQPQ
ncbi:MAG TPA: pitrilysin family protein [Terriglobales bacterium]|nr:pitrilysin family protein [Terriglobales bacterium]